ncbi:hypothetical protein PV05_02470 [Exophiala xenobiotica]|uniref:Mediator of RNA polymerase II transcription subunit 11 n=1 Tax=Exophiala xenobiotica TaxID=348802 RepID=A0A0D2FCX3_9EURO|nr:uncharacterized protein PV05_02470 [Exophiala xenobiotica]KIW57914.1 hypothetical protein PV05_02470 [Exophiala xenobiotica]
MDTDEPASAQSLAFTPADRITELNEIDRSIATLLSAASDAIGILSNQPNGEKQERALQNSATARTAFSAAAETYFSTLSSIEVRLRRQVYALEEANLIRPGDERDSRRGRVLGGDSGPSRVGGGPLDPSWLSARASGKVDAGMKRELLSQAREFVERADKSTQDWPSKISNIQDLDKDMG